MTESQIILSLNSNRHQALLAFVLSFFNFLTILFINFNLDNLENILSWTSVIEGGFAFLHFFLLIKALFFIEKFFDRKFHIRTDVMVRYLLELLYFLAICGILFTVIFLVPVAIFHYLIYGLGFIRMSGTVIRELYIIDMVFAFILYTSKVGLMTYTKLQEVELEADRLERENAHEQFETLKKNINPDFLFHSLRTLSGLINQDKDAAGKFIEELSSVYRYNLDFKEKEMVLLDTEIQVVQSYLNILKIQYGTLLKTEISVAEKYKNYLLPPFFLQFLIDLLISGSPPDERRILSIQVFTNQDGELVIRANPSERSFNPQSIDHTLSQLLEKYGALIHTQVETKYHSGCYEVCLKLIEMEESKFVY